MPTRRALLAAVPLAVVPLAAVQASTPVPDENTVELELSVVYGEIDGVELVVDVHRPPARVDPRPAVVLIHGGGWTQGYGDRSMMSKAADDLASAGYVAFNVTYRLLTGESGVHPWPAQLDDVQRAVRWIRANAADYGVDPERIGSFGESSGGHLAAFLGVRETRDNADPTLAEFSSRVTCVVDQAGDMDLTIPYPQPEDRRILVNLLGGTVDEEPEAYRDASPIVWVDAESAPFMIFHGAKDDINPVEHSRTMENALHDAGAEVVYYEHPGYNHFSWRWSVVSPWALTFLEHHLEPER